MKKNIVKLLSISLLMVSLTGCLRQTYEVVVTNYPVQFLVESIAKDRVNVTRLEEGSVAQRATIREDYEDILKKADVLFYINETQPYFELYEEELKNMKGDKVDLSYYSKLYEFKRYHNVMVSDSRQTFESEYYETDLLDNADLYTDDPILWIDPIAMTSMGRSVLDYLVDRFPDQRTYFEANFEELEVDLVKLYADYQLLNTSNSIISFATMTPDYGNWQKSYGINVYPLTLSKYGVLPDEELLNVYREKIIDDGVRYIAYDDSLPDDYLKLFNKVKTELNLESIELHNLFTLTEKNIENNEDYIDLMYHNLDVLIALQEEN